MTVIGSVECMLFATEITTLTVPNVPKETLLRALHAFDEEKIQIGIMLRRK